MRLSSKDEVEAPVAFVFAQLSDFGGWERAALRRGSEVHRTDAGDGQLSWSVTFSYRGKPRHLALTLDEIAPPSRLAFSGAGASLDGVLGIDLVEMAPRRTRIVVKVDVRPRTLVARLFVQSLKLARGRVETRFRTRASQIAGEIEDRYRRGGAA